MEDNKTGMRILMTADTVGGVWTYCMELCRSLQNYRAEIHLVTMGDKLKDWQLQEISSLQNVTIHETAYRLEWMQDPWADIGACGEWLLELESTILPDVIHLNCFAFGSLSFKAPVLVVAHSDVWSWFLSVKDEMPTAEWKTYYRYVKEGLTGADSVIAPSNAKLRMVESIYGLENGKVIYNSRDKELFAPGQKEPFVFSMGRIWDEAKNVKLLSDAAPLIEAPVRIAGDNNFGSNSFEETSGTVTYLGKLTTKEVARQLAAATVYVLPAKYEPFGLSVLEAALSGCALVLGDISTLRELWQDAAIYVDTDDAEALAATINALLKDDVLLNTLAEKAKSRARMFSTDAMAKSYWQEYMRLVKSKHKIVNEETV